MTSDETLVGRRWERRLTLTREAIVAFAEAAGDSNPLHHDDAFAAGTRFGGLIASGAHTVALLMGFCASESSRLGPGVGLAFDFKLVGPAKPDVELIFAWTVVAAEASERPRGTVLTLEGSVADDDGRDIVRAAARVLRTDRL
ncbi:MAG: MaoC family dehydratase [Vulcanimicrobiaceae bacterium]